MKQSQLFTKTRKEAPKDEVSKNAQLLIRAGFIHKQMAGVYSMLPLGNMVMEKIKTIVRDEMNKLQAQELFMSSLQKKELWTVTDRWDDKNVDVWFKSQLKNGTDVGFGWSHEEPITSMMKDFIGSYRDLPVYVYQFQNKLRNEVRAKSGIMRCREFIMKDMYSYCIDEKSHMDFYNKTIEAYMNVYKTLGLGDITYVTSASGGVFTDKFSHEFQTICPAGEDKIYVSKDGKKAYNEEVFNEELFKKESINKDDFEVKTAAEVGNIFTFGTKKCEQLDLFFIDKDGTKKSVFLGSYGIGITRVMGVMVETFSDEKGIVWPENVAPFKIHLISLGKEGSEAEKDALALYEELTAKGVEVLFDDRDTRAGEKFADSDLIGIPYRIVVSDKTLASGGYELKVRKTGEVSSISKAEIFSRFIS